MPPSSFRPPPGATLREAHAHLAQHALALSMLDLATCSDAGDMLERVTIRAESDRANQRPLLAGGARPEAWPARPDNETAWPPLAAIDAATGDRPFCAWCFDYHALLANTAALRAAGVTDETPDQPGAIFARDPKGNLTGVAYEHAATRVWDAVIGDTLRDPDALATGLRDLAAHRFVSVHDLKAQPWLGPLLRDLEERGDLPLDTHLWPLVEDLEAVARSRADWESQRVRLAGGKIFVDGTLNSRTAWMLDPYTDADERGQPGHPRGIAMMSEDEIEHAARLCDTLGLPMAAHAIGDAAVRAVLDAIERVRPKTPGFRIEHAEFVHERDIPRFAELGVICSVQPCHMLYDIEALQRAAPDRLERVLPLRALIDAGCAPGESLIFGSDTPIVRPDPGDSVQAAIARRRVNAEPSDAIAPAQAITELEAWKCFENPPE